MQRLTEPSRTSNLCREIEKFKYYFYIFIPAVVTLHEGSLELLDAIITGSFQFCIPRTQKELQQF